MLRFSTVDGTPLKLRAAAEFLAKVNAFYEKRRTLFGLTFLFVVFSVAAMAIVRDRISLSSALRQIGPWPIVAGVGLSMLGAIASFFVWREILGGLKIEIPWSLSSSTYFVSQLGKYLPGSVWPVLMQMEVGRSQGASRRTMFVANIYSIVLNCVIGLSVGCLFLSIYDRDLLNRYWWALLALPLLVALLHPRAISAVIDRLLEFFHQPTLGESVRFSAEVRAAAWSIFSWFFLGVSLGVIASRIDGGGFSKLALCFGAMAFAWTVGVLFIPAPAGAGIRDVFLAVILSTTMSSSQSLAVILASRAAVTISDLILAGVAGSFRLLSRFA